MQYAASLRAAEAEGLGGGEDEEQGHGRRRVWQRHMIGRRTEE